jgi:hypothetical protein
MLKIKDAKSIIREVPIFEIGVPNSVGNIYTEKSVASIFKILEERGYFCGELVDQMAQSGEYETRLEEASHIVPNMFIADNFLVAVVKFRMTRNGKTALKMFEEGMATLRPTLRGKIEEETKEVIVNDVLGLDLIPVNDKLLQKEISWINIK